MSKWGWYALAGGVAVVGVIAAAMRTLAELVDAVEWDEDPFDEMMDTEDLAELWRDTIDDIVSGHFSPADALTEDGELPDVVVVGYGMNLETLPAALSGLWKVLVDDTDSMDRTEAIVRGHSLVSQLRVLLAMYETYTSMGLMERVEEIDDTLPYIHSLLASISPDED
jgi:hypothetical protein